VLCKPSDSATAGPRWSRLERDRAPDVLAVVNAPRAAALVDASSHGASRITRIGARSPCALRNGGSANLDSAARP